MDELESNKDFFNRSKTTMRATRSDFLLGIFCVSIYYTKRLINILVKLFLPHYYLIEFALVIKTFCLLYLSYAIYF